MVSVPGVEATASDETGRRSLSHCSIPPFNSAACSPWPMVSSVNQARAATYGASGVYRITRVSSPAPAPSKAFSISSAGGSSLPGGVFATIRPRSRNRAPGMCAASYSSRLLLTCSSTTFGSFTWSASHAVDTTISARTLSGVRA